MLSNEWAILIDFCKKKVSVYFGKEVLILTFMILNKIMDIVSVIL